MADDEGEVVRGGVGGTPQGAHDGAFLAGGFPGQAVGVSGGGEAVVRATLAPLAAGFGTDAAALGQHARGFARPGDLARMGEANASPEAGVVRAFG